MDPEDHPHADKGYDVGMEAYGILVLRLRPGRMFTLKEATDHVSTVIDWVCRKWHRVPTHAVERDSFSMYHDMVRSRLIVRWRMTYGWEPEFLCYARTLGGDRDDEHTTIEPPVRGSSVPVH